jgi:arylsulfatase A-like enzyme
MPQRLVATLALMTALGLLHAQQRPNILLITLDTVRADRMGFLGSTRGVTPALDAFAKRSIVFERAYAQAPVTTVSHATILSGTFPPFHSVSNFGSPLPDRVPYLSEVLRSHCYRTGALRPDCRSGGRAQSRRRPGTSRRWYVRGT